MRWSYFQSSGPRKANATMRRNPMRLMTATRCRRNLIRTSCSWVRSLVVIASASYAAAAPVPGGGVAVRARSLIADPRVEHGVEQVGDQVGDHDQDAGDEHECQHGEGVDSRHGVDEVG